ncbi:PEP-CTERM sorting domain-containing protein [Haliangium ochraceum]|uniref:PEP-CTERM sorting domain-containing protein n=1 Tax=Haliangium ochraceum TaxID=80816 RepID=UPI0002FA93E9|nr:PEP-CTERM sorting domain-containing protein [Haliangium ochraceum]
MMIVCAAAVLAPRAAEACSCMRPPPPQEALAAADAVFEGTITTVESGDNLVATFAVERAWKGVAKDTITVATGLNSAMCGLGFAEGERWLVYAMLDGDELRSSLCSRTARSADAADDLAALGEGSAPSDASPEQPAAGEEPPAQPATGEQPAGTPPETRSKRGCGGCAAGAVPAPGDWAPLLLVAAGALLLRRRRIEPIRARADQRRARR